MQIFRRRGGNPRWRCLCRQPRRRRRESQCREQIYHILIIIHKCFFCSNALLVDGTALWGTFQWCFLFIRKRTVLIRFSSSGRGWYGGVRSLPDCTSKRHGAASTTTAERSQAPNNRQLATCCGEHLNILTRSIALSVCGLAGPIMSLILDKSVVVQLRPVPPKSRESIAYGRISALPHLSCSENTPSKTSLARRCQARSALGRSRFEPYVSNIVQNLKPTFTHTQSAFFPSS